MDDEQLMWLAGWFEAEGSVITAERAKGANAGESAYLVCQLVAGATDRDAVERCKEIADCGSIHTQHYDDGRKPMHYWSVRSQADFLRVSDAVGPLLLPRKLGLINSARRRMHQHKVSRSRINRSLAASPIEPWIGDIAPVDAREHRLAWVAGMIEGDGTFGWVGGKSGPYPHVTVQVNDEDTVDRLREWTGIGVVSSRVKAGHKVWAWRVSTQAGFRDLCSSIGPLLLERRAAAMQGVLALLDGHQEAERQRKRFCSRGHDKDVHGRTARNGCKRCARFRDLSRTTAKSLDELLAAERDGVI